MIFSLILIYGSCWLLGGLMKKLSLPPLLGMILSGICFGPFGLDLLSPYLLAHSGTLRTLALIIVLTRAGLNLNVSQLKQVGRPAFLLCFLPASIEILGCFLLAPILLGVSSLEALLLGFVLAAVSPAVIVPSMIKLMNQGWGKAFQVPQMILASASVDDVLVMVGFTTVLSISTSSSFSTLQIVEIPLSITFGILLGWFIGRGFSLVAKRYSLNSYLSTAGLLAITLSLMWLEQVAPISGLLAVMTVGAGFSYVPSAHSAPSTTHYAKLWSFAEPLLFSLVGASVNWEYALQSSWLGLVLIGGLLLFRSLGVWLSFLGTSVPRKARAFTMIAYCPKATVQATIGGIPLAMGLACGELVLSLAVLAILVTAPLGAIGIQTLHSKLLDQ